MMTEDYPTIYYDEKARTCTNSLTAVWFFGSLSFKYSDFLNDVGLRLLENSLR
jgi:hypothetical protein